MDLRPDVVFNLVESLAGWDRLAHVFPSLLESLGLPYTGNSAAALWLTNNKLLAKERLRQAGLPTPPWYGVEKSGVSSQRSGVRSWGSGVSNQGAAASLESSLLTPDSSAERDSSPGQFILKAVWEHASFGLGDDAIVTVADAQELRRRVEEHAARLGRECFAERFIEGREFNLSLLTDGGRHNPLAVGHGSRSVPTTLPPAEIDFSAFPAGKPWIVGYEAKWDDASFEFHQTPRRFDFPPEDGPLVERLSELARRCWEVFDLRGYVRVDFRVDRAGGPWILEINTNPCLSPDAGYTAALQRAGISYEDAMERIVEEAGVRRQESGGRNQEAGGRGQESGGRGQGRQTDSPLSDSCSLTPGSCPTFRHDVLTADPAAVRRIVESTGFFYAAECDVAVELVEERLAKGEASGYSFAFAELNGRPVAYACYGPIACTAGSFDLFWIAVDQGHQRLGLGRLLLEESERLIRGAGGRRVYIETSNRAQYQPTRAFYERCGYHCEAVLKEFYGPGDDKVVYVKAL